MEIAPYRWLPVALLLAAAGLVLPGEAKRALADEPTCHDRIKELAQLMALKGDDYSELAKASARKHLAAAKVGNPFECKSEVTLARRDLERGKFD